MTAKIDSSSDTPRKPVKDTASGRGPEASTGASSADGRKPPVFVPAISDTDLSMEQWSDGSRTSADVDSSAVFELLGDRPRRASCGIDVSTCIDDLKKHRGSAAMPRPDTEFPELFPDGAGDAGRSPSSAKVHLSLFVGGEDRPAREDSLAEPATQVGQPDAAVSSPRQPDASETPQTLATPENREVSDPRLVRIVDAWSGLPEDVQESLAHLAEAYRR